MGHTVRGFNKTMAHIKRFSNSKPETYLGPSQTSTTEIFSENISWLSVV